MSEFNTRPLIAALDQFSRAVESAKGVFPVGPTSLKRLVDLGPQMGGAIDAIGKHGALFNDELGRLNAWLKKQDRP